MPKCRVSDGWANGPRNGRRQRLWFLRLNDKYLEMGRVDVALVPSGDGSWGLSKDPRGDESANDVMESVWATGREPGRWCCCTRAAGSAVVACETSAEGGPPWFSRSERDLSEFVAVVFDVTRCVRNRAELGRRAGCGNSACPVRRAGSGNGVIDKEGGGGRETRRHYCAAALPEPRCFPKIGNRATPRLY